MSENKKNVVSLYCIQNQTHRINWLLHVINELVNIIKMMSFNYYIYFHLNIGMIPIKNL